MEIELERTFLLKYKPKDLDKHKSVEIFDIYIPKEEFHPVLRVRGRDRKNFEITKKFPIAGNNSSEQEEHTIILSKKEFDALSKLESKKVRKIRYYYDMPGTKKVEVDIFLDELKGLCMVDFEFKTKKDKDSFVAPDFCLAEVTQDKWLAGGMLAGGKCSDLEKVFKKYKYKKI